MNILKRNLIVLVYIALFIPMTATASSIYDKKQALIIQGALDNNLSIIKQGLALGNTTEIRHKSNGKTALHIAAERNAVAIVDYLISINAALNAKDNKKETPLHKAIDNTARQSATLLIEAGADIDAANRNGETPLILAARKAKSSMIKLLLQAGADQDIEDLTGLRAIDYAEQSRRPETALLFELNG